MRQKHGPKNSSKTWPLVSIIILNWNGGDFLVDCLRSLSKISYPSFEIIIIDNNSKDNSINRVKKKFTNIIFIENSDNFGFAGGNNIGAQRARGKYLLFLNNDTIVTKNFLQTLVAQSEEDPRIGCVQPQIRLSGNQSLLDVVGSYLTWTGFLYHMGYHKSFDVPGYQNRRFIFSAKGACMLIPKELFETVGSFDSDFFIFFEETDLCFRLWLAGYEVMYEPNSIIYHFEGGDTTKSDIYSHKRRVYLTIRNMICSYVKNFGWYHSITILPFFIVFHMFLMARYVATGQGALLYALIEAYSWNIHHWKETLRKRRFVQHNLRKVSDRILDKTILYNPKPSYFFLYGGDAKRYNDSL